MLRSSGINRVATAGIPASAPGILRPPSHGTGPRQDRAAPSARDAPSREDAHPGVAEGAGRPGRPASGAPGGRRCRTARGTAPSTRAAARHSESRPGRSVSRDQRARGAGERGGVVAEPVAAAQRLDLGGEPVRVQARPGRRSRSRRRPRPGSPPGTQRPLADQPLADEGQREQGEVRRRRGAAARSGSAGETSVSVRTRSGRRAATRTETAPPIELPTRCDRAAGPRASISRITVPASALIE